ncbi:MAG: YjbQ family protein [Bacteroidales bacterium]|nr:YjbQ family protein [Bacteroidales bacterium]
MITQKTIKLPSFPRGYHLITSWLENELDNLPQTGFVHIFIKHTSAALSLNENADPTVRYDFESFMNKLIPENDPVYQHVVEGADDMPAHLKSSLLGASVMIPISNHRLNMGIWQGVYLCEFRNYGGPRQLVITIYGE